MEIEIVNWDRYQPRKDVERPTWFRLENNFWFDPAISSLQVTGKLVWVYLLSVACLQHSCCIVVDTLLMRSVIGTRTFLIKEAMAALEKSGKIKILRDVDVTRVVSRRNVDVPTDRQTNKQTYTHTEVASRQAGWEDSEPLAKVFAYLTSVAAYKAIFDLASDKRSLTAHMERNKLTIAEMEQVSFDFSNWADGPAGKKMKSPRGTFATFIRHYVERKSQALGTNVKPTQQNPVYTVADVAKLLD